MTRPGWRGWVCALVVSGCADPVPRGDANPWATTVPVPLATSASRPPVTLIAEAPDSIAVPAMARVLAGLNAREPSFLAKRRLCMLDSGAECAPMPDDTLSTAAYRVLRAALGPEPARGARAPTARAVSSAILRGDTLQFLLQSSGCVEPFRDEPINSYSSIQIVRMLDRGLGTIQMRPSYHSDGFSRGCPGADRIQKARSGAEGPFKPDYEGPMHLPH